MLNKILYYILILYVLKFVHTIIYKIEYIISHSACHYKVVVSPNPLKLTYTTQLIRRLVPFAYVLYNIITTEPDIYANIFIYASKTKLHKYICTCVHVLLLQIILKDY